MPGVVVFFCSDHQPRVLRKCIKVCLKKYEGLAEDECVKRFCYLLKNVWNWEQEIFTCNLGVSLEIDFEKHIKLIFASSQAEWAVPISLVLGPSDGISYQTQNSTTVKFVDISL